MTVDYPDWTRLIQLVGANIMMPIDMQASYIMMPIDIQGQYIDLDVEITADNITSIMLALTAETMGNIFVDLKAQTITDLRIDIDAQSVGIFLQAEWAAKEGTDKSFNVAEGNKTFGDVTLADYPVPAVSTLLICSVSFCIHASAAADANNNQMGHVSLENLTDSIVLASLGGNGGGAINFGKPLVIPGGKTFRYLIDNRCNHTCVQYLTCQGYEV